MSSPPYWLACMDDPQTSCVQAAVEAPKITIVSYLVNEVLASSVAAYLNCPRGQVFVHLSGEYPYDCSYSKKKIWMGCGKTKLNMSIFIYFKVWTRITGQLF